MFETIEYTVAENVAWIRLNRPDSLNAFVKEMNREVTKAFKRAATDENVRCIVLTGAGRGFCSGQDLSEVSDNMDHGQVIREHYGPMIKQMMSCEKPIIGAINGVAAGAGFSLALACDFRLVSKKASFVNAFVHVGLIPDSANLYLLPKIIGRAKALELAILGEKISAEKALELGLATKVISLDEWDEQVSAFAKHLAKMPTKAIGLIKRYINHSDEATMDEFLELEAQGQRIAGLSIDHKEGVASFLEKRKPAFIGK